MEMIITEREFALTPKTRAYAERKIRKVAGLLPRVGRVELVVGADGRDHRAEISIHANGHRLFAAEVGPEVMGSIDIAAAKIAAQARKFKERLVAHHR